MCVGQGQGIVPMMKTFSLRVEKVLFEASFTVTMSKALGWDGRVALGDHSFVKKLRLGLILYCGFYYFQSSSQSSSATSKPLRHSYLPRQDTKSNRERAALGMLPSNT